MNCYAYQLMREIAIVKLPSKVAFRGIKTYSESRTEHRNLPFFNKMLEKESHQSSHVTRKAWMFRRILQKLKKFPRKTWGYVFIFTDFKKPGFDVSSLESFCVNNYRHRTILDLLILLRLRKVEFFKKKVMIWTCCLLGLLNSRQSNGFLP